MSLYSFPKSNKLFERAAARIPGGIPGHQSPALTVPGAFPYFAERAQGCRYWDVDGNEFIDFMCGYGPIVLGYNHPKVEAAAAAQRERGFCFNHPSERTVELAEKLCDIIPIADWAVFARNGSDITTWSLQVAREHTQRNKVIMARGAYHGTHAWCTPGHGGLTMEDTNNVLMFTWNNADEIRDLIIKNDKDVAAIILTPYHHPAFGDSVLPAPGFYQAVRSICDEYGIVMIIDDVRAGFRLNMGGSSEYFGGKADMICYSKAIANGYTLSAGVGRKELKNAAGRVFFTGSFWSSPVELAASLATIDEMLATNAIDKMLRMGKMLQDGLKQRGEAHGLQVSVTGPPSIPNMTFANETNFRRMQRFSAECSLRGVFFHPHHNWFISAAHEEADIKKGLDIADEAFAIVKKEFGS